MKLGDFGRAREVDRRFTAREVLEGQALRGLASTLRALLSRVLVETELGDPMFEALGRTLSSIECGIGYGQGLDALASELRRMAREDAVLLVGMKRAFSV